jgi:hypothetical protein
VLLDRACRIADELAAILPGGHDLARLGVERIGPQIDRDRGESEVRDASRESTGNTRGVKFVHAPRDIGFERRELPGLPLLPAGTTIEAFGLIAQLVRVAISAPPNPAGSRLLEGRTARQGLVESAQLVVVAVQQQEVEKGDVAVRRRPRREATRSAIMVPRPIRRRAEWVGPTMRTTMGYHQQTVLRATNRCAGAETPTRGCCWQRQRKSLPAVFTEDAPRAIITLGILPLAAIYKRIRRVGLAPTGKRRLATAHPQCERFGNNKAPDRQNEQF